MIERAYLNTIFQNLAEFLDIPESYFEQARSRYEAIGNWLERDQSAVYAYKPTIYPQGSFLLGTVIKPASDKDEYDIDLVCRLDISKRAITQKRLKGMVGLELETYRNAHNMKHPLEERRRSWRLNYSDSARFHLDILPAIPETQAQLNNEIAITDNQQSNYERICAEWVCCNPIDYAEWFKSRMKVQWQVIRKQLAESLKARMEDVPDYKIKTPLQRVVQILKRHRDMTFKGNEDDKPVSIIITTLAAHAYDNEPDILDALVNAVTNMANFIEEKDGVLWVENPVNPSENFADKWQEYPRRQETFLNWLHEVEIDVLETVNSFHLSSALKSLKQQFGESAIKRATKAILESGSIPSIAGNAGGNIKNLQDVFMVDHRQEPTWIMRLDPNVRVEVSAKVERNGFRPINYYNNDKSLSKKTSLRFFANINTKQKYDVYWQVVNTGKEAYEAEQPRGGFYETSQIQKGKRIREESTLYTGQHWVECFIVKNGVCIARSGEFVVNIA